MLPDRIGIGLGSLVEQSQARLVLVTGDRELALRIIDDAIQAHGAGGVSDDFGLANAYAHQRTLRLADGPDEVHARAIARIEFARHAPNVGNDPGAPRDFSSGDMAATR